MLIMVIELDEEKLKEENIIFPIEAIDFLDNLCEFNFFERIFCNEEESEIMYTQKSPLYDGDARFKLKDIVNELKSISWFVKNLKQWFVFEYEEGTNIIRDDIDLMKNIGAI